MKSLPIGINGLKIYEIKDFRQNLHALKDGRKWKKNCPTEWKNHGRVRFADCKGSYKCIQEKCPFKMEFGVTNTTQFEKEGGAMICKGCGKVGEYVVCSARRYLSYRNKSVTVYHIGNHTCPVNESPKKGRHEHRTNYTESTKHQTLRGTVGVCHVRISTANGLERCRKRGRCCIG